jgi:regulator of sigma E protease
MENLTMGLSGMASYLLPFLLVITVLVFVHEMGHYLVARWNGVKVEVFSIGFGPELFGWTDKVGTRWKVSLVPLGGYVRMYGDEDAASRPSKDIKKMSAKAKDENLHTKKPWQRIAVFVAGPAANYLFAIVVLFALYATSGQPHVLAEVSEMAPNSAALKAGLKKGDLIVKADDVSVRTFHDLQDYTFSHPDMPIILEVKRGEKLIKLTATPDAKEMKDRFGRVRKTGSLGVMQSITPVYQKISIGQSAMAAACDTWTLSVKTLHSVGQMIMGLRSSDELGGVLMIAKISGDMAQLGVGNLIMLMALLSINLGLVNLFPIPMLDGGHIMLCLIEVIRGKPVSEKAQEIAFRVGFVIVISIMAFSLWNDLAHHLKVFSLIKGLFAG